MTRMVLRILTLATIVHFYAFAGRPPNPGPAPGQPPPASNR
jgi:hypothetical protein